MNNSLKISIITVSFNAGSTIEDTIKSVISQSYDNIEYIIIDSASTDNTIDIVESFKQEISYFISERDKGIYHGMNKGIKVATGDIIGILNADDVYPNRFVIEDVINHFLQNNPDTIFGDLVYVDSKDMYKVVRYWKSGDFDRKKIQYGWMLPHPTFFIKKEIYDKYGVYSDKLKSAADYEMMLRLLYKNRCTTSYLPKILVNMRSGGYSNESILHRLRGNSEDVMAWRLNDLDPPKLLRILKPLSKVKQFIRNPE